MKKLVGVNELEVGMYVTRVTKSQRSAIMTSEGIIKSTGNIAHLKKLKVLEVEIDASRSEGQSSHDVTAEATIENTDKSSEVVNATPLARELPVAKKMYAKAREFQRTTFDRLKREGTFNAKEFEALALEFLDSITRNSDALLCMTKMQNKDAYLLEHSLNVSILLTIFAKHLNFNSDIALRLTLAGLLHDMGKVRISDDILLKNGKLTKSEYEEIKNHTVYGAEILEKADIDGLVVQVALEHHERLSGGGYPQGLLAHQLNQYVRMSCIVDVFDAMTAERVYKPAMTAHHAFKLMKKAGPEQFDDALLNEFIKAVGLFSIGTLVMMASQKIAVVTKTNFEDPLKPTVTIFYNAKYKRHIEVETLDLSSKKVSDSIEKAVNPSDFDIDINAVIDKLIVTQ